MAARSLAEETLFLFKVEEKGGEKELFLLEQFLPLGFQYSDAGIKWPYVQKGPSMVQCQAHSRHSVN